VNLNRTFPALTPLKPFETGFDLSNELFGWQDTARQVERIRAQMPHPETTFVFGHRFHSTSQLAVYLPRSTVATTLHQKFNQYRFWFDAKDHEQWDALFVVEQKRHQERARRYEPLFDKMDRQPVQIRIFRNGRLARQMEVYKYFGFKGKYEP